MRMKTIQHFIAAAFLLLVGLTEVDAQSNFGEFKWGLKGGVNFASVYNFGDAERDKGKVGFMGGAFAKIPLKHFLSIRPELLFNMKGATLNISGDASVNKTRFATNYLEVPVSLDFDLPYFLDFHAGVQGALLLTKKIKVNGAEVKGDDNFENAEFGWHVGTGIDLGNIGVHVRFQQSLSSFYGSGNFEPRNWGISLTGSYMFMIVN